MGLADEIDKRKRELAAEEARRLAWARSHVRETDAVVTTPTGDVRRVVQDALPMLKFPAEVYVGPDPSGTLRISFYARRKTLFGSEKTLTNQRAAIVPVSRQGKDEPNHRLVVLRDGRVAWLRDTSALGSPPQMSGAELEKWFADHITQAKRR